jgi:reverse gyrase
MPLCLSCNQPIGDDRFIAGFQCDACLEDTKQFLAKCDENNTHRYADDISEDDTANEEQQWKDWLEANKSEWPNL